MRLPVFPTVYFVATLVCLCIGPVKASAVEVRLSYTETRDRILPTPNVTITQVALQARIAENGEVEQSQVRASGGASKSDTKNLQLGEEGRGSWRVAGPNQIASISSYDTFERAILVTVDGKSCTARIGYTLKPGFNDYRYRRLKTGEQAVAKSITASAVVCLIQ